MTEKTVLIAGASGVVGHAALEHFHALPDWRVVAVSRRSPALPAGFRGVHLPVDLTDAADCARAAQAMPPVTHLAYAALHEKPGLVRGWREADQMQTNLAMLRNLVESLLAAGHRLQHVSLLQGTKAYGVHLHPVAVPAREEGPRDPHENFYWLQEDYLRARAAEAGFAITIFRPQLVFGDALGVAMNLVPIIGVHAALCADAGEPFAYPGGPSNILEATDARLLARALAWAAQAPTARGEIFNVTNGDVFVWRNLWPEIADSLGVRTGPDRPLSLARHLPTQAARWDRLVQAHGLAAPPLAQLLGESHHYADFCFGFHAREAPPPVIVSTIKIRQAGFADCIDTGRMFRDWFTRLREQRILPTIEAAAMASPPGPRSAAGG
ncbi:MAG: NAD-dependent epimerase/dehydratase family protein [Betaproteobacteria bacterium]|nr:NAD-dependent epimerase/dehydratase family protein [Betaproteobacteria bacterium]